MKEIVLIVPEEPSDLLYRMINKVLNDKEYITIKNENEIIELRDKFILFAVELNKIGSSNSLNLVFEKLYEMGEDSLLNSRGAILIHSNYSLFSKTTAQSIVFLANNLGCSFVGRPLVEATVNLENLIPMRKVYHSSLEDICLNQCAKLGDRFLDKTIKINKPIKKLLVLHSSHEGISNTLTLWNIVKSYLKDMDIVEINVGNSNIEDCKGCPYKTCKHFGNQSKCFYGGIVVEEIYPAILECNSVLFICPNYNDMITANLVASINRLTALYRKTRFYDKNLFAIIVSGYSGSDAIAKQLISSLNMNKTFNLPPYFSLMATANDKGSILEVPDIYEKAKEFSKNIMNLNRKDFS